MTTPEEKIAQLGLLLPPTPKPAGLYQPFVVSGKLAFLSGQISKDAEGKVLAGKVGKDLSFEQGRAAARLAALNILSIMKHLIGFEKINRIVKMTGFVQTAPDFYEIPAVVNGASEILGEVLGERGTHARSAVGMSSLPLNAAVEIEIILELK
ncbi:MAG TPA: RidA family protein [Candidatus Omnitrophota bacterium]|nr:RidA family protein [Candidatus Omnitrophota bacterium]HRY85197.1 RidA family protein [Candidatus Omnitrophota bacterium]